MTRIAGLLAVSAIVFAACSSSGASTAPSAAASTGASAAAGGNMDALVAAAKAEGGLTTIALPHSWCNYGEMLTNFTSKYGIPINELNPDGSSAQEVDAITANKTNPGPQAPDVIDVGLSFGPQAKTDGLIAPYKVATWDSIPASAKDADGYWYGDYFGVMSFEVNTSVVKNVPADWSDLLKPEYKGQVALAGDPTQSNQAISAVWAAAIANGGSLDDASAGLTFFKQLNDAGNFVPVIGKTATVASGETPIRIAWTYNGLGDKDSLAGNPPITVTVPKSGRFGGMYVQAISAYAPHPNAAKLWMEYLYSDEGQNVWLKGYCNPIRYDDMVAKGTVDAAAQAKLPDSTGAGLPTLDQITKATDVITKGWPTTVGAAVK
jgi:putative spermidine/putrescine transport system substrate-binding protein